MPALAANLSMMFNEYEFLDRFAAAARVGFKGVEYLFPYQWPAKDIAARLSESRLEQVLFNMPPGDWDAGERGIAALPGRESEFEAGVAQALDYAAALGCTRVHCMAGLADERADRAAMQETYLRNLRFAAAACGERGVRLLIEPINTRDMPGYFLNRSAQALQVIDAVGSDNLFLQYDVYHMQIMEGDLLKTIESIGDSIAHFQIAGVPDRHEPDTGEVNYPFLFAKLDARGYDGWWGCEYRPAGRTEDGLGWARPYGVDV